MTRYAITDETYQRFSLDVRGQEMRVIFYFILSSDAWYADIFDSEGNTVALGERMVSGVDTGTKFGIEGVFIAGPNGEAKDPDSTGWKDLYLYVLDEDELDPKKLFTVAEPTYLIDADSNPIVDPSGLLLVAD